MHHLSLECSHVIVLTPATYSRLLAPALPQHCAATTFFSESESFRAIRVEARKTSLCIFQIKSRALDAEMTTSHPKDDKGAEIELHHFAVARRLDIGAGERTQCDLLTCPGSHPWGADPFWAMSKALRIYVVAALCSVVHGEITDGVVVAKAARRGVRIRSRDHVWAYVQQARGPRQGESPATWWCWRRRQGAARACARGHRLHSWGAGDVFGRFGIAAGEKCGAAGRSRSRSLAEASKAGAEQPAERLERTTPEIREERTRMLGGSL
ncbi:hypothetical protein B0H11DRAFT_2307793 [Mycena galericulata]|nr:hypothetical protein B0H11DRAFT_2307793 [Mycena galericulata]